MTHRHTDRQTDRQAGRRADKQTDRQLTHRQTHRQSVGQSDRQTDRQTDRQGRQRKNTGRQRYRETDSSQLQHCRHFWTSRVLLKFSRVCRQRVCCDLEWDTAGVALIIMRSLPRSSMKRQILRGVQPEGSEEITLYRRKHRKLGRKSEPSCLRLAGQIVLVLYWPLGYDSSSLPHPACANSSPQPPPPPSILPPSPPPPPSSSLPRPRLRKPPRWPSG